MFGKQPLPGLRTPDALFSFNYDERDNCRTGRGYYRTQATIAPLGAYLNLTINNATGGKYSICGLPADSLDPLCFPPNPTVPTHNFGPCCNVAAADAMKEELFHRNETHALLASWEHLGIPFLANALGANNCTSNDTGRSIPGCTLDWPNTDFDTIYALYFDAVTQEFITIDTNLAQGMVWVGPNNYHSEDNNFGPGEKPGVD